MSSKRVPTQTVEGFDGLGSVFVAAADGVNAADYTETFDTHLVGLEKLHAGFFSSSTDPNGRAWPALSPVTVARKGHATILVESEALRSSLTGRTGDSVRATSHRGLLFGTSVEYSGIHQEGGGNIPQRAHVGLTEDYLDQIVNDIADFAVESMKP